MEDASSKRLVARIIAVSLLILLGSYVLIFSLVKGVIEQEAKNHMIQQARAITVQAEATRRYVSEMVADEVFDPSLLAEAQKYIGRKGATSKEEILKVARLTRYYRTIPIVASWTVGQGIAHDALYTFRVVRVNARSSKHEATPIERQMLDKIDRDGVDEYWQIDEEINALRYMRPIVMKKECMLCHGSVKDYPEGQGLDPLGIKMEGWERGEQHGAFEIISDLKPMQEAIRKVQRDLLAIGMMMIVLMLLTVPIWFQMVAKKE
ncbi:MAG: DUF3365 domain-containing protein [Magnetococcales bacterium]|nr:DUF3365 domain-containing protein [Magnetococcales bacterium]